jgi:hypothetical protein
MSYKCAKRIYCAFIAHLLADAAALQALLVAFFPLIAAGGSFTAAVILENAACNTLPVVVGYDF